VVGIRLNFGQVSFKVRLMLFSSGIWYGKLIFLKITFKENFIYLKNVIGIYIYTVYTVELSGVTRGLSQGGT